jgi:hypothetical protein
VLITTLLGQDLVTFDGSNAVLGPLLLVGVPAGTHRVVITPERRASATFSVVVSVGRSAVVGFGRSAPKPRPGEPPRLLVASAMRGSPSVEAGARATPTPPRLWAQPVRADDLARFHCDPVLDAHLPSVASLLAETEAACAKDAAWACAVAARQWFSEVGVRRRDPAKAVARLEHACRLGDGDSCEEFARMLAIGNGIAKDGARATEVLEATCGGGRGHARSCAARAWAILPDAPTTEDRARAAPFLQRACELDTGFCSSARELRLRLSCGRGDHGACQLLLPDDAVRVAMEGEGEAVVDSTAAR